MRSDLEATPKLGFGCMRLPQTNPDDPTAIDIEQFKQMALRKPRLKKRWLIAIHANPTPSQLSA